MFSIVEIDGYDITPFIAEEGIKYELNDIDAPSSGRTMDGKMHRARVTQKVKIGFSFVPVVSEVVEYILKSINNQTCMVRYIDPILGVRTCEMYSGTKTIAIRRINIDGNIMWTGLTFNLIEV